jgi:hypothetical protein
MGELLLLVMGVANGAKGVDGATASSMGAAIGDDGGVVVVVLSVALMASTTGE